MKVDALHKSNPRTLNKERVLDYINLTKPTITLLVAVTVIPSLLLAAGGLPNLFKSIVAIVGASLASASAAVFNQVVETDIDVQMHRTKRRSLASGRISRESAAVFGLILGIIGIGMLYAYASPIAALTALAGHLFYVLIYTLYLKKRTDQNIVIGGAAGSVGPLIGWAAITGSLSWPAWVLFAVIFLWTPPHFWALALKYKEDYAQAGIPMYPVIHGEHKTRLVMFLYTLTLIPCVASLFFFHQAGIAYFILSMGLTLKFAFDAYQLYSSASNERAMPFFHYSCLYVFGVFGALTLDCFIHLF